MRAILSPSAAESGGRHPKFWRLGLALLVLIFSCSPITLWAQNSTATGQNQAIESEAFRIKADGQYELARLYFKSGDIDKAFAAIRQIVQSPIPLQHEEAVVKAMDNVTAKLKDLRRFDLAQSLLDDSLKVIAQKACRTELWQMKAKLFLLSGENDKAIEAWKRAKTEASRQDGK